MKNYILLYSLLALSFYSNAQTNNVLFEKKQEQFISSLEKSNSNNSNRSLRSSGCFLDSTNYWDATSGSWTDLKYNTRYTYDLNHNILTQVFRAWNGPASMEFVGRNLYTYDLNDNRTSLVRQSSVNNSWVNYAQNLYTYDANNNCTGDLDQSWINNSWVNQYQEIRTYDANNNKTSFLKQMWTNGAWTNTSLNTLTYDSNNKIVTEMAEIWNAGGWKNSYTNLYTYDASGKLIDCLMKEWDGTTWQNSSSWRYTYDANNNRIKYDDRYWNVNRWEFNEVINSTYDVNHNLLTELNTSNGNYFLQTFYYDIDNNNIAYRADINSNKHDSIFCTYDANNNLLDFISLAWDATGLNKVSRYFQTYDSANNKTSLFKQDWNVNAWVNIDSTYYYYNLPALLPGVQSIPRTSVFPNPGNGQFSFSDLTSGNVIEIYSMTGRLISRIVVNDITQTIDLTGNNPGFYSYRISNNGQAVQEGNIVIQ